MTIPYTKNTTWADGSGGATPITAAKLNNVETGVSDAHLMPAVRVTHNAAQSVSSATATALAFNTERFDQVSGVASTMHDTVTNNSRLTCRHAGVFQITGNIEWAANPTAALLSIRLNGTTLIARVNANVDYRVMHVTTLYALAVNDYVELVAQQNSGGAINVSVTANVSPEFMMARVG